MAFILILVLFFLVVPVVFGGVLLGLFAAVFHLVGWLLLGVLMLFKGALLLALALVFGLIKIVVVGGGLAVFTLVALFGWLVLRRRPDPGLRRPERETLRRLRASLDRMERRTMNLEVILERPTVSHY